MAHDPEELPVKITPFAAAMGLAAGVGLCNAGVVYVDLSCPIGN